MSGAVGPGPAWADRGLIFRTLTFWLRPVFALRVLNRFQRVAGFDRSIALASSALTAIVPLAIVSGAALSKFGVDDVADRLIKRYDLTGAGADAVKAAFSPASGQTTSIGILGVLLMLIAVLSFSRGVQRLFEQAWELPPLSMRNTVNDLRWIVGLVVYLGVTGVVHAVIGHGRLELAAALVSAPITAVFFIWSGWILSARRIDWHDLRAFGVVAMIAMTIYSIGATVYVPHLFSSYADRYGAIGAVLAMISTLFCIMVILVASAAVGREVADELDRLRRGERPRADEVHQEWDALVTDLKSRLELARRRVRRSGEAGDEADGPPGDVADP